MKIISKCSKILPFLFLAVTLSSCSDDDDVTVMQPDPNIVELAQASPSLSILVDALVAADGNLPAVLSGEGPFTVLAPTNDAFNTFLDDNGFTSLNEVPTDVLSQILLNHVISGEVRAQDLIDAGSGYTTTSATGADGENLSLYFDTSSGVRFNGVSSVTNGGADVEATNGVVHVVDAVIGLPTVVTHALANPALSNLVAALQLADTQADPMLIPVLNGNGSLAPFTVFAPTNDAFEALLLELDDTGATELGDLDPALVEAVLLTHVVSGANITSDELASGMVPTLGGDLTLDAGALTLTDPNGRVSNIVPTLINIQGTNGVVHVIDAVLLPQE